MKKLLLVAALLIATSAFAAENSADTTAKRKKIVVDGLKLSGVIQVQWQMAETKGGDAFAQRGNFPDGVNNRMEIRRARFKMLYNYDFITAQFQINASTSSVSIIEANVNIATRSKVAGITTGVFYKPYGYMMQRSASIRIQPELSRISQTLMPSDIGLGAYATFTGKNNTFMNQFKLDLGILTEDEFMNGSKQLRNFIGRLEFAQPIGENTIVGAEMTVYAGGVKGHGAYTFDNRTKQFVFNNIPETESKTYGRNYYDAGLRYETKTGWGDTKLFGEFMWGSQPGYQKTSQTSNGANNDATIFNRKYLGGYIYFQQQIAATPLSFAAQFDYYDPNRQLTGKDIDKNYQTNPNPEISGGIGDMAYTTLGLGLSYKFCKDIMAVSAWYDFVWNEKCDVLPAYRTNIKDNVFTLRLQCAF